jgi:DNA transposition AAA+ family ATPase
MNQNTNAQSPKQQPRTRVAATYVKTATSARILDTLGYCHDTPDLGVIYGGPGVGKTRTARQYRDSTKNVCIMTASPEVATVHPMLEELARSVGLEELAAGSRAISRAVRDRLLSLKNPFIVVDEAQHLNLSALESLRSIHDETEVGMCLMGNTLVYERLTGGSRVAHFAQLFSRMGIQLHIKKPTKQDVEDLAHSFGVENKEAVDMLHKLAARPGALRSAVKVMRLAVGAADANPAAVRIDHIKLATANLGLEYAS